MVMKTFLLCLMIVLLSSSSIVIVNAAAWAPLRDLRTLGFRKSTGRNNKNPPNRPTFVLKGKDEKLTTSTGDDNDSSTSTNDVLVEAAVRELSANNDTASSSSSKKSSSSSKNIFEELTSNGPPSMDSVLQNVNDVIEDLPKLSFLDNINFDRIFDISKYIEIFETSIDNMKQGEVGKRGEIYFIIQAIVAVAVLFGGIPIVGDLLSVVCGPGLFLTGLVLILLSIQDLGTSLTPWIQPIIESTSSTSNDDESLLKTDGLYSKIRHPMYCGLISLAIGFSTLTGSIERLLLSGLLFYILDIKTQKEEQRLLVAYPTQYSDYMEKVPGKFVPPQIFDELPWSTTKQLPAAAATTTTEDDKKE